MEKTEERIRIIDDQIGSYFCYKECVKEEKQRRAYWNGVIRTLESILILKEEEVILIEERLKEQEKENEGLYNW